MFLCVNFALNINERHVLYLYEYLEAGEEAVEERVEVHAWLLELEIAGELALHELAAEELGAEEGEDAEEEEEQDEEWGDGLDGADEGAEQVLQGLPVPGHLQVWSFIKENYYKKQTVNAK